MFQNILWYVKIRRKSPSVTFNWDAARLIHRKTHFEKILESHI